MLNKKKKRILDIFAYIALIIGVVAINLPTLSMIGTSLKGRVGALTIMDLFPPISKMTFSGFKEVLQSSYPGSILNSAIVAVCVTIICIVVACLAGYVLSRYKGGFFSAYLVILLVLQMFPIMLLLIPMFIILKNLGLIDSLLSLIISYSTLNIPFTVWLLKGFFDSIPVSLEEAALIDGCSRMSALVRVVIPISLPGIATVGIYAFLNAWNEYTLASVFIRSDKLRTITTGLAMFSAQNNTDWGLLMSASTIATIPSFIFLIFVQKYLIQGMTAGSVKG